MDDQDKHNQTFIQKAYTTSCDIANETAEYLASFQIGQTILKQTDRLFWTVEKCAEWSIPNQPQHKHISNGTFGKSGPLIRPLPWVLFLPMLLFLRCLRLSLSVAALLLGFETVKPISMVRFIQVRRRKVRALKFLGLRRIRHRKMSKDNSEKMTFKERFYNIMSRAMCFRVTNSDLYEEITIKKNDEEPQIANRGRQRSVSGRDLKRKYIEILKNNYCDWEDVEDDEELIERITQLAEDEFEEDSNFVLAEDSATEEDSMSDTEDNAIAEASTGDAVPSAQPPQSSPKKLQRLSSHGSLANEIIEEELEESDSTTVSANSDDESSQHLDKSVVPKKNDEKIENKEEKNSLEPVVTSDEYYSPMNSISASPEPSKIDSESVKLKENQNKIDSESVKLNENQNKIDSESVKTNENQNKIDLESVKTNENQNKIEEATTTNEKLNSEEKKVVETKVKNNENSLPANHEPITARESTYGVNVKANSNSNSSYSPRLKKHKHRRRFSNLLRRKRK